MENIQYRLTLTDDKTGEDLVTLTAHSEELLNEKLGAWERAQRKAPLVVWPPNGARQCQWCGDVTDGQSYCDVACQYDEQQEMIAKHEPVNQ